MKNVSLFQQRDWRGAVALGAFGLVLLLFPEATLSATQWQDVQLQVEGRRYHVRYALDRTDGPTLVLESGIAARIGHWDPILPELARIAPVFAYERPGMGASPEDPSYDPTPEKVAESLRILLRTAEMPSPYLLVGHSLGGIYAKAFVDLYPEESAGIVLIDPTDFNESWSDWGRLFEEMGVGQEGQEAFTAELDRLYGVESLAVRHEWQVLDRLRRGSFARLRTLDSMEGIPVRVVLGTRVDPKPDIMDLPDWFSFEDFQRVFLEHRHLNFWRWIVELPDCRLVTTTRSGHFIHQDEPDLVLREIRDLYDRR